MQTNVWLNASHLAGVLNTKADRQSRHFNEQTEWHLTPDVKTTKLWGVPDIDFLASRLNKHLPQCFLETTPRG